MNDTLPPNYPKGSLPSDPRVVELLIGQAYINGHSINEMLAQLKITLGFFNQWRNGVRKPTEMSQELAEAVATYLELPVEVVFAAAKPR